MFVSKIENEQVRTSDGIIIKDYTNYLNALFESYAISGLTNFNSTYMHSISKQEQQKQIREALMKGYVEMSHINLTICMECQYAEYDAQHTTERLVSGG